ncbi:hypothetical protein RHSIM_Rhsim02G0125700 [Rhododendron simsii]|uniref:Hydroxymethylglutaryl-coenzyme A synthase C-terminal domain-containing protein n=1 Tax=Rhododendron simsii TaxID=118357 RepID=A0A834HC65_RHOSS|nr:hypothetical protein RHSIM_Rhsim02G0125700 [Rhododendron simsii]
MMEAIKTEGILPIVNPHSFSENHGRSQNKVYAEGPGRPTGGAAAIAMLIGPDAPIAFESKFRGSHTSHAYDFYKPNLASEYPVVDGKLSQACYLMALDYCYKSFCKKYEKLEGKQFSADDADYFVFHSPYNKLAQKSIARLVFSDYLRNASSVDEAAKEKLASFSSLTDDESYTSRDLEKASQQVAKPLYDAKVQPATLVPKQVGNMYSVSLYAAFVSLIHNKHSSLVPVNCLIKRSEQTPLKEKITDFCNDLQKLATRVKESENAERGNGKKSLVVAKK